MNDDLELQLQHAWDRFHAALEKCRNGDKTKYDAIVNHAALPPEGTSDRLQKICELLIPAVQTEMLTSSLPSEMLPNFLEREKEFLTTLQDIHQKVPHVIIPREIKNIIDNLLSEEKESYQAIDNALQSFVKFNAFWVHERDSQINELQHKIRELHLKFTRKLQTFERKLHHKNMVLLQKLPPKMLSKALDKDNFKTYCELLMVLENQKDNKKLTKQTQKTLNQFFKFMVGATGLKVLSEWFSSTEFNHRKTQLMAYFDASLKTEKLRMALEKNQTKPSDLDFPQKYSPEMLEEFELFLEIQKDSDEEIKYAEHWLEKAKTELESIGRNVEALKPVKETLKHGVEKIEALREKLYRFDPRGR